MKIAIRAALLIVAIVLAYLIYDGIMNKIEFKKLAQTRKDAVIVRLSQIRDAQKSFKQVKGRYANNFDELIHFVENDSIPIIKAVGTVPDTLTAAKAVELGIVTRDTTKVPAKTEIFREGFVTDSIQYIPYSGGKKFSMKADMIEKNKVNVSVFMASAPYESFLRGLNTKNENVNLDAELQVGSLTEPVISGNWE